MTEPTREVVELLKDPVGALGACTVLACIQRRDTVVIPLAVAQALNRVLDSRPSPERTGFVEREQIRQLVRQWPYPETRAELESVLKKHGAFAASSAPRADAPSENDPTPAQEGREVLARLVRQANENGPTTWEGHEAYTVRLTHGSLLSLTALLDALAAVAQRVRQEEESNA